MPSNHITYLRSLGACSDSIEYASKYATAAEAWAACESSDWMLWLCSRRLDRTHMARIAGKMATDTPLGDGYVVWDIMPQAGRDCLVALRGWLDGTVTDEQLSAARAAACVAARAATWVAECVAARAAARKWQCDTIREMVKLEDVYAE